MENVPASLWIAACAHRLQQQWHTVERPGSVARRTVAITATPRGRSGVAEANHRV